MSCVSIVLSGTVLNASPFCRGQNQLQQTIFIVQENNVQGLLLLLFQWPQQNANPTVSINNGSHKTFFIYANNMTIKLIPLETIVNIKLQTNNVLTITSPDNITSPNKIAFSMSALLTSPFDRLTITTF